MDNMTVVVLEPGSFLPDAMGLVRVFGQLLPSRPVGREMCMDSMIAAGLRVHSGPPQVVVKVKILRREFECVLEVDVVRDLSTVPIQVLNIRTRANAAGFRSVHLVTSQSATERVVRVMTRNYSPFSLKSLKASACGKSPRVLAIAEEIVQVWGSEEVKRVGTVSAR